MAIHGTLTSTTGRPEGGTVVLRVVFEGDDLQRVRLATAADPMWELLLSLWRLQSRTTPRCYQAWYEAAYQRISTARQGKQSLAMLCELVPKSGDAPDFLTPATPVTDIDAGCELLASTSIDRIHTDLVEAFGGRPAPSWLQSMVTGGRAGLRDIVGLARQGHNLLVASQWSLVSSVVDADRIARSRTLADSGVGALLAKLPGVLHWDGRVLQTRYPEHRTVHLRGRGLRLIPSYFCWGNPVTWIDPELPPALVYQAHRSDTPLRPTPNKALAQLLGDTRADCLAALHTPRTTSQLAEQVAISAGMASKHATVLRAANLITSDRCGGAVIHRLTPLGVALLRGTRPHGDLPTD